MKTYDYLCGSCGAPALKSIYQYKNKQYCDSCQTRAFNLGWWGEEEERKNLLVDMYIIKELEMEDIVKILCCHTRRLQSYFKKYNIPPRYGKFYKKYNSANNCMKWPDVAQKVGDKIRQYYQDPIYREKMKRIAQENADRRFGPKPTWLCIVCGGEFKVRQKRLICSPECKEQRHKEALVKSRISNRVSWQLHKVLKGKDDFLWSEVTGYNSHDLYVHLEKQFIKEMSWDNYGTYWVVDHIIPKRLFNHRNRLELSMCWALPNLQPLERCENEKDKGGRIDYYSEDFYEKKLEEIRCFVKERFNEPGIRE